MNQITENEVYLILKENFPKQNDFNFSGYKEELNELLDFGINTSEKLREIIKKHKSQVLEIDSEDLDEFHISTYSKEFGEDYVKNRIENKYLFAYQGLLRIIIEHEFGEKDELYSDKRDNII